MQYAIKYCELAPGDDRAWNELGRQRLMCNQLNEAVEALLRSIELGPFNATARNNLGAALHRLGRHEEAVAQLRVAASHDPLNTGALLNQSAPLIKLRRPLEAIQVMQEATRIAPEKASIWATLGALHMEVGKDEDAEQCLRRALELHPGLHEAKTNLETLRARRSSKSPRANRPDPSALIAVGRFDEAEAILLEVVAKNPRDVDAWHNLGIIAAHQHREQQAIERFERVVALRPEERFARRQLVRLRTGTGDLAAALRECDELAQIPEERLPAVLLRAQLLQGLGRTSQAIQELKQVVQANPELDQVWFVLSEVYERDRRFKESLSAAQKALGILQKFGGHADSIAIIEDRIARLGRLRS